MDDSRQKILIVDDEPINIKLLAGTLKDNNYLFVGATNGKEALECARDKDSPDLILLDIIMPHMDGYEVCQQLKADQKTQDIPVIFITVMGDEAYEYRGFELGAVDYIAKPFRPAVIRSRVKTHLELKQHRDLLERMVQERTENLSYANERLKEVNTTLNVLLKKREKDRIEIEEKVLSNVKEIVIPYIERLKKTRLDKNQSMIADIIEVNLNNIISSFAKRLSSKFLNFTPMEIRIANLIKDGKTNKEIAEFLCLSKNTILTHRHNLRTKLRLKHKKINLRTYLSTLEE